ncbi:hypothetical protein [Clostridium sp.]|uniref:hypothetical protein n=1 Tax=Clostridium sp. TaxID=1506 RepID=UPI001A64168C|nr:hypothetical protein [Clostridium sp.]MBK5234092.1 hypothetical protein [Clostridium sp.]
MKVPKEITFEDYIFLKVGQPGCEEKLQEKLKEYKPFKDKKANVKQEDMERLLRILLRKYQFRIQYINVDRGGSLYNASFQCPITGKWLGSISENNFYILLVKSLIKIKFLIDEGEVLRNE